MFKPADSQEDQPESSNSVESDNLGATTPNLKTPSTAASISNTFFSKFFPDNEKRQESQLDEEIFKNSLQAEVEKYKAFLIEKNYYNLHNISSSKCFWLKNSTTYPLLTKLASILLNINSSSAFIERYFSICGFASKKNRSNIGEDLFIKRCMLRANIDILNQLNNISY